MSARGAGEPSPEQQECLHSGFWQEVAEPQDPYTAALCRCAGYDVYGDLLGKLSWIDYLYLLFHGEAPTPSQAQLLNDLAVALANPGPRDNSVHAAMSGGAGGSGLAACLMAALGVGAGNVGGAREVYNASLLWRDKACHLPAWRDTLLNWGSRDEFGGTWPAQAHPPGFAPYGISCAQPVRQSLACLARHEVGPRLNFLSSHRLELETFARCPLAMSGVAAAALADLKFCPQQAEMLTLLLRLPGAAVHALEQHWQGTDTLPFFRHGLQLDGDEGQAPLDDPRPSP